MFRALFSHAQHILEDATGLVINRVLLAVPFLTAAGFVTAAATSFLTRRYGVEIGCLMIAAIFAIIGLVAAPFLLRPPHPVAPRETVAEEKDASNAADPNAPRDASSDEGFVDPDVVMSMLSASAPALAPILIRFVLRHWALFATLLGALVLITRKELAELDETAAAADVGHADAVPTGSEAIA